MSNINTTAADKAYGVVLGEDNLVSLCQRHAINRAKAIAYTFLKGEVEDGSLTFEQLDAKAEQIAANLQMHVKKGERAVLLYPAGLEFVTAFLGCMYAGVVAVPSSLPQSRKSSFSRLKSIIDDCDASLILSTEQVVEKYAQGIESLNKVANIAVLTSNVLEKTSETAWQNQFVTGDDVAFLQYTSGSTGTPKGVVVSHGNLMHNESLILQGMGHDKDTVMVGWLPLFHDMGLIGNVLQPLYLGVRSVLMSPMAFLQKPSRWLEAISKYKATTSGGPNFAYELCIVRVTDEQKASLDLSHWKVAFNGAEPIRAATLQRFVKAFASCGFKEKSLYPCYGLAEATLFVTGCKSDEPSKTIKVDAKDLTNHKVTQSAEKGGSYLVSSGRVWGDQQVYIVNPDTQKRCADGEVGEIWIKGPSIAQGYWQRAEVTEQTFHAYTQCSCEGPFFRTGDLGSIIDGEVFVTGRLKEMIIIRGCNHYPQDIELTAQVSEKAFRMGCGAAFSVERNNEEQLVVVQEVRREVINSLDPQAIFENLRQVIAQRHALQLHGLVLIKPQMLPKTSSGKIQRGVAGKLFDANKIPALATVVEGEVVEGKIVEGEAVQAADTPAQLPSFIRTQVAKLLAIDEANIALDKAVIAMGMDSLKAIQLHHIIEDTLKLEFAIESFFDGSSINDICQELEKQKPSTEQHQHHPQEQQPSLGLTQSPLLPNQKALWYIQQLALTSTAYNLTLPVLFPKHVNKAVLLKSLNSVLARHPVLNSRFEDETQLTQSHIAQSMPIEVNCQNPLLALSQLKGFVGAKLNQPFDLSEGPMCRVDLVDVEQGQMMLVFVVHHVVADLWSLQRMIIDLAKSYSANLLGLPQPEAVKFDYYDYIAQNQQLMAKNDSLAYWTEQLSGSLPILNMGLDHARPVEQQFEGDCSHFTIEGPLKDKLVELAKEQQTTLFTVLLAAYQILLYRYTGQDDICIGVPTAGRDQKSHSSLVGYCVNPVVMRTQLAGGASFEQFIVEVKQTVLGALANQQLPIQTIVEKINPVRDSSRSPLFQTMFSLLDAHEFNDASNMVIGTQGGAVKLDELEFHSVDVPVVACKDDIALVMAVDSEKLMARLDYSCALFERSTIEQIGKHFVELLESLVAQPKIPLQNANLLTQSELQSAGSLWQQTV
ncbi:MAG: AMP-binding protein, partial [Algicola sp.]|nr:AMP-binding protein [Algicola sp.]